MSQIKKCKNQVKDAICALSHIMNASGFISSITPEHFRQGKFDKPEVMAPLTRFLLEVTEQKKMTSNSDTFLDCTSLKSILSQCCFIPGNPSSNSELSSQDLLLCVGWHLARSGLVNKVVKHLLWNSPLLLSLPHLPCGKEERERLDRDLHSSNELGVTRAGFHQSAAVVGKMKCLVWMMGHLRLTLKALHSEEQAISRHVHHVHSSTQGAGVLPQDMNHLSARDAYVLRHLKLLKNHFEGLEKEAAILQACLSWQELEPVFWQWMVSVYEARQFNKLENSSSEVDATNIATSRFSDTKSAKRISHLCNVESSFSQVIQRLEAEIASKNAHQILQEVHSCQDAVKRKADIENIVKTKLACNIEEHLKSSHQNGLFHTVQFSFKSEQTKHTKKQKTETLQQNAVAITSEILRLTNGTRRLQREIEELRLVQRERLYDFAECLNNVVCIPPMSEKGHL